MISVGHDDPPPAAATRRRLLFINRSYWPDVEATGQLLTELCESLAESFEVTVICGWPLNELSTSDQQAARQREHHGVRIRRVWHTRFNKRSFWGRVCNMVTFAAGATLSALFTRRADTVIVETDPPLLCLVGRMMQWFRRARLVCYLQDIYPDVAVALDKLREGRFTRFLDRLFYSVYRHADSVVVLSRDMQQHLAKKGVAVERLRRIPNWIDVDQVVPVKSANAFRTRNGWDDKFVVMYSGNLGLSQPWTMLLDAIESLRDEPLLQFVLIGGGAAESFLRGEIRRRDLQRVALLPYQAKSDLSMSLSAADVHLVFLDQRIAHCLMPSKIYGVMASGTGTIVVSPAGSELAQLVADAQAGVHVANQSASELVAAIRTAMASPQLVRTWGENARRYAEREFDISRAVEQFRCVLA